MDNATLYITKHLGRIVLIIKFMKQIGKLFFLRPSPIIEIKCC